MRLKGVQVVADTADQLNDFMVTLYFLFTSSRAPKLWEL